MPTHQLSCTININKENVSERLFLLSTLLHATCSPFYNTAIVVGRWCGAPNNQLCSHQQWCDHRQCWHDSPNWNLNIYFFYCYQTKLTNKIVCNNWMYKCGNLSLRSAGVNEISFNFYSRKKGEYSRNANSHFSRFVILISKEKAHTGTGKEEDI